MGTCSSFRRALIFSAFHKQTTAVPWRLAQPQWLEGVSANALCRHRFGCLTSNRSDLCECWRCLRIFPSYLQFSDSPFIGVVLGAASNPRFSEQASLRRRCTVASIFGCFGI